jgi:hypothetical protein
MLSYFLSPARINPPSRFMAETLDILWKVTIYEKLMSIAIFSHFPPPESTSDLSTVFPP